MALFNFGKKKEEEKKTPACACSCGCAASEAESITNDCCPDLKEGEICCIKVLGAGCKSCHEQFEYTKQAVKDMGLSVEVEYITDMQKVMEYGVMSMPALVVNEKVVAICGNKTRTMIREDTELSNFPLYCPKCKKETSINAQDMKVTLAEHK